MQVLVDTHYPGIHNGLVEKKGLQKTFCPIVRNAKGLSMRSKYCEGSRLCASWYTRVHISITHTLEGFCYMLAKMLRMRGSWKAMILPLLIGNREQKSSLPQGKILESELSITQSNLCSGYVVF